MIRNNASNRLLALLAITLPLLGGCVSIVTNKPATNTDEGLRYSLPVPVLQVTPQPDGTMAIEVLYLPDPKNTYVVSASSFIGSYTLDVKTNNGLLDTVSFSPDSTGVATQAITSYGEISKAKIEAAAKADADAAKKADDKAKAAATAAQALTDAKTTLAVATAKRDKLIELGAQKEDSNLIGAELAIVEAQQRFIALQSAAAAEASSGAMNKAANTPKNFTMAAGTIFYRMVPSDDNSGRVDLIPDAAQVKAETSKPVKATPKKPDLAFSLVGPPVIRSDKNGLSLKIRANQPIYEIVDKDVSLETVSPSNKIGLVPVSIVSESGDTYLYAVFDDHQAPGKYKLSIPVVLEKGGDPVNADSLKFEIRPPIGK